MRQVALVDYLAELRISTRPTDLDRVGRAVTVLGNDDLGDVLLGVGRNVLTLCYLVVIVAVKEDDNVSVLLDRARFTQIAYHRLLAGTALRTSGKLGAADNGNVKLLCENFERTRDLADLLRSVFDLSVGLDRKRHV